MTTTKIDAVVELRTVVADDNLPAGQRRDAAVHLVALKAKSVPSVPADDEEVLAMAAPWRRGTDAEVALADTFKAWSGGHPLDECKAAVALRWQLRARLAAVVDDTLPLLERLETTRAILDSLPSGHIYKVNTVSAERLMASIENRKPASVPPMKLDDVFDGARVFALQR